VALRMHDNPPPVAALTAQCGTVRARLRRATADSHERLHRHTGFVRLMTGVLTLPEYAVLLAHLYGFHRPLEARLRAAAGRIGNPADPVESVIPRKAYLLRTDLLHLGIPEAAIRNIPMCDALPAITSPEQLMGCLYVLEGAGLGGIVMARALDRLLDNHDQTCRLFLMGGPDPDPGRWPKFCRWLEARADGRDIAAIERSARRSFECMERWLRSGDSDV
jgi:heme oxygenase